MLFDALFLDPAPFDLFVSYRTDNVKGSGTLNDPWDCSSQPKFDKIMRELPSNVPVRVHIGPSPRDATGNAIPFQTQGYYNGADPATYGWQPKPAMKIVGSGIDVTVIQLVGGLAANNHYFAIGHALANGSQPNNLDFCEVSDLTIDCNLQNQSNSVACGAVCLMGNHVRIRNVKAKNWGNKLTSNVGFVLAVVTADPATTLSLA